jgi:hypothetical protein
MSDVEAKRTDFTSLLVYDVSRWGRFHDVDESAYYQYALKRDGIRVHYCAELFENNGSMSSSVLKTLSLQTDRVILVPVERVLGYLAAPWIECAYQCVLSDRIKQHETPAG